MKNASRLTCGSLFCLILFAASSAFGAELYVASGGSVTPPYDTWAKAAPELQTPLGIAVAGDTVWVSNGVYGGAMGVAGGCTNTVIIPAGVTLHGVNGPPFTTIQGADQKRCVFLSGSNTVLNGFTLTGGIITNFYGGGVYCVSNALVTNCLIISNSAEDGGGAYLADATIANCAFITNTALDYGGGLKMHGGLVDSCLIESNATAQYSGGGIYCRESETVSYFGGRIQNCVIRGNTAQGNGGGIDGAYIQVDRCTIVENQTTGFSSDGGGARLVFSNSVIRNTLIYSNSTRRNGGGLYVLYNLKSQNCTMIENTCESSGGGVTFNSGGIVENTIIYNNYASLSTSNQYWFSTPEPTYTNCCMSPITNGTGNIDLDPEVDGMTGLLLGTSPCVDAGTNQAWMVGATDWEGDPRIFDGVVDIGSDETRVILTDIMSGILVKARIPREATYQWQFTDRIDGTWSNYGLRFVSGGSTISLLDSLVVRQQGYYRLEWIK